MKPWSLPTTAVIGGVEYGINADYRDILQIMEHLQDPEQPEYIRWHVAVALFYEGDIPDECRQEAVDYLAAFITCGEMEEKPGPKLLDWEQDAQIIVADVNKVAGTEIRSLPFLHWWTFVSYFHAIGEGQLSTVVSIRDKLHRGKPLEKWEQEYYRRNQFAVDLKQKYTASEEDVLERFAKMLGGRNE